MLIYKDKDFAISFNNRKEARKTMGNGRYYRAIKEGKIIFINNISKNVAL